MTNFSRRSFLKTSGAGVAATLGGFATTSMAQTPAQKFDKEADVIVVGLGGAGAATAITAADNGASVIVIERQPAATLRSNTRMSGGIFHCPDKTGNKAALKEYARSSRLLLLPASRVQHSPTSRELKTAATRFIVLPILTVFLPDSTAPATTARKKKQFPAKHSGCALTTALSPVQTRSKLITKHAVKNLSPMTRAKLSA